MQDLQDAISSNSQRQKTLIAAVHTLAAHWEQQLQAKRNNEAARALFRALGWEK